MTWRALIPRVGWLAIDRDEAILLDLHPAYRWEGLSIEWLGYGVLIACRIAR
jgi:hypothetical protein